MADDKANDYETQAKAQEKDADERRKANEGKFDAEAETNRVRDEVMNAPEPGKDPDATTRVAKTLAASGIDAPHGYTTDPVTDEERQAYADKAAGKRDEDDTDDTSKRGRRAAAPDRVQGRSTTPRQKAAEEN